MRDNKKRKIKEFLTSIKTTAIKVNLHPTEFFKNMPENGGLHAFLFMVSMVVLSGVVSAIAMFLVMPSFVSFIAGLQNIIIVPFNLTIFLFVGVAVLFITWRIMGSKVSLGTSYRCVAYMTSIMPLVIVLRIIPFVGVMIGYIFIAYLLIVASIRVHHLKTKTVWKSFGIACLIVSFLSIISHFLPSDSVNFISPSITPCEKEMRRYIYCKADFMDPTNHMVSLYDLKQARTDMYECLREGGLPHEVIIKIFQEDLEKSIR